MARTVTTIPDAEAVMPTRVRLRTTLAAMTFTFCLAVPMTRVCQAGALGSPGIMVVLAIFAIPVCCLEEASKTCWSRTQTTRAPSGAACAMC